MRLAVLCSHELHRRNLWASGLVRMLEQRGHTVLTLGANPQTFNRVRRTLRLMTMVHEEPRSLTYRHKATLLRGTRRWQAAVWRALRGMGWNLEALALRIEARLPIPAHVLHHLSVAKPDVLVWPTLIHMDALENDTVKAARRLRIPIIGMPASWDNLTTKGLFLVRPDRLLVWGVASQRHAIELHGFSDSQVTVTGPPHFYPYESGVTFSGSVVYVNGTSIHYLRDEDLMVEQMRAAMPDRVIVHSQHPRRRGGYCEIDFIKRNMDAAVCLAAAFSTTVIEAALCGRPSVLVGFGAGAQGEAMAAFGHQATGLLDHMKYEHMAEVIRFPGVRVARSLHELCAIIRSMANGDAPDSPQALRAAAMTVAYAEPGIRERIVGAIEEGR